MDENASNPLAQIELPADFETDVLARTGYVEMDQRRCVSLFVVGDLQEALRNHGLKRIAYRNTLAILPRIIGKASVMRRLRTSASKTFFAAMMGKAESFLLPYSLTMEPVVYCFDCWSPEYTWWISFFKRYQIRTAFFSARASASFFANALPGFSATWIPEATNMAHYPPGRGLISRSIDVLELGRRYDRLHKSIVGPLRTAGKSHLYENVGKIFGTTRAQLAAGLAETKISVCFPRYVTHPEVAGNVETTTHRYFESMASGCLLYGHCPGELQTLFGYNPMIEMDAEEPAKQILELLRGIDNYQPLVRKNYQRMREVGTWESRVPQILEGLLLNQMANRALLAR